MERKIMIRSLPEAMSVVKEMNVISDDEWTGDYRRSAKDAIFGLSHRSYDRQAYVPSCRDKERRLLR